MAPGGGDLDADVVRRWTRQADAAMRAHRDRIDALNVFPVADRDTGSNLVQTVAGAAEAVAGSDGQQPASLLDDMARGAALAAHGNSGIIVAQLLRGLADQLAAEPGPIGADLWCRAFEAGRRAARDAVQDPVEGTVLSVLAAASQAGRDALATRPASGVAEVLAASVASAATALTRTQSQLGALAEAGVVDAGGAGVLVLLDALLRALTGGASVPTGWLAEAEAAPAPASSGPASPSSGASSGPSSLPSAAPSLPSADGGFFEVQYLIRADPTSVQALRDVLTSLGSSVSIASVGDGRHAVHVHVLDAGAAIEAAFAAGLPRQIKVRALPQPAPGTLEEHGEPASAGVVAMAAGAGIAELFRRERVVTVEGPAGVEEVLAALLGSGARRVVLLPNSAETGTLSEDAASRARGLGIGVAVVPTRSPVQGLAAVAVHDPNRRFDDDVIAMAEAAAATRVGEVSVAQQESITYAGRCQAGDVLGLIDGEVVEIGSDFGKVGSALARRLIAAGGELVTVLAGAQAGSAEAAAVVERYVRTRHPLVEVTALHGGQADCPLLIGVE